MSIPTCPHCHRRAIPQADGTCPACGKDPMDLRGSDPNRVMVSIHGGTRLPGVCHHCGEPTERLKTLAVSSDPQGTSVGPLLGQVLGRLIPFLGLFLRLESAGKTTELRLKLPTCRACAKVVRRIQPQYIDFEDQRVDLIVHVRFRSAIARC